MEAEASKATGRKSLFSTPGSVIIKTTVVVVTLTVSLATLVSLRTKIAKDGLGFPKTCKCTLHLHVFGKALATLRAVETR